MDSNITFGHGMGHPLRIHLAFQDQTQVAGFIHKSLLEHQRVGVSTFAYIHTRD
jgi:hypothetical protein